MTALFGHKPHKIYSLPISLSLCPYLILVNIPFRVSCCVKDMITWMLCAPVSLKTAQGLISSRGPGVSFPRLDTIMPGHSGNYLRALSLSVLVFFANIHQDIPASIPSQDLWLLWEDKMCVSCRIIAGRLMGAYCDLSGDLIMRASAGWLCGEWVLSLESKHGNKQRMDEWHGRSFRNLII